MKWTTRAGLHGNIDDSGAKYMGGFRWDMSYATFSRPSTAVPVGCHSLSVSLSLFFLPISSNLRLFSSSPSSSSSSSTSSSLFLHPLSPFNCCCYCYCCRSGHPCHESVDWPLTVVIQLVIFKWSGYLLAGYHSTWGQLQQPIIALQSTPVNPVEKKKKGK